MRRWSVHLAAALLIACVSAAAQPDAGPSPVLPSPAVESLGKSLAAAARHRHSVWRDAAPFADGGLVQAFVEIPRGERRKWEFDIAANERAVDRVMPETIGGYPVNYGFVPQTISYDGDPFDALVLGPALEGASLVRGAIVGLMLMEDEKGPDAKVVLSPLDARGRPAVALTDDTRDRIGAFFRIYKQHESGAFSRVPGWRGPDAGRDYVEIAHAFFLRCRADVTRACRVDLRPRSR